MDKLFLHYVIQEKLLRHFNQDDSVVLTKQRIVK